MAQQVKDSDSDKMETVWTATLFKTVSSAGEPLENLLKSLSSRGDDYEKASINVHALSEEKRATFCDEMLSYFIKDAPSFEKMASHVELHFDEPRPQWPTSSILAMTRAKSDEQVYNPEENDRLLQWDLRNQCSGQGFTLSIKTKSQNTEVIMMGIRIVAESVKSVNSSSAPQHLPSSTTGIADLPVGLLGRALIQHMPWRKRVQVEGVCRRWQREALTHGWADVKELRWGATEKWQGGVLPPFRQRIPGQVEIDARTLWRLVEARAGPHLTTMSLSRAHKEDINDALRAFKAKFPKLNDLCLEWRHLSCSPDFLEQLYKVHTPKLKTLHLQSSGYWMLAERDEERQAMVKFFQKLDSFPLLEHLEISSSGGLLEGQLPPDALRFSADCQLAANLRRLVLSCCSDMFDTESLGQLPALCPTLRSLTFEYFTPEDHSFLQHFSQLEHLSVWFLEEHHLQNFNDTLPHLGGTLKALEVHINNVRERVPISITLNIASRLPKLEHLGVEKYWCESMEKPEVDRLLGNLSSLETLRSLHLSPVSSSMYVDWGWLTMEIRQRLEYLELGKSPPLATIYNLVRNGKKLRHLKLRGHPIWNAASMKALADAASLSDGRDGTSGDSSPPETLHIGYATDERTGRLLIEGKPIENPRVRFVPADEIISPVLRHYREGSL